MKDLPLIINNVPVRLTSIQLDHHAFCDYGLVTAEILITSEKFNYTAYISDGEVESAYVSTWADSFTNHARMIEILGDYPLEQVENELAEILEPIVSQDALTESVVAKRLEEFGLILFGRDPARDYLWEVGKHVDGNTYETIGWFLSLRSIMNNLDKTGLAEHF